MRVRIATRHCTIPERLKKKVEREVDRLKRFYPWILEARVTFIRERHLYQAEVGIHVNRYSFHGRERAPDPELAFGQAIESLAHRLKRYKERRRSRRMARPRPPGLSWPGGQGMEAE